MRDGNLASPNSRLTIHPSNSNCLKMSLRFATLLLDLLMRQLKIDVLSALVVTDKWEFVGLFARKRANRNSARASRSKFCRANRNWLQSSHRNYRRNGGRVSNRQPEAAEFKLCCRLKGGQQFRQPVRLISTARQGRFRSARAEFRLRSPDRTNRQTSICR